MVFCCKLRILISQQVFQSPTFTAEEKNTSELQVPIVIGVYLAKLQFVPKAILTTFV